MKKSHAVVNNKTKCWLASYFFNVFLHDYVLIFLFYIVLHTGTKGSDGGGGITATAAEVQPAG